jgi:hypothetical protein
MSEHALGQRSGMSLEHSSSNHEPAQNMLCDGASWEHAVPGARFVRAIHRYGHHVEQDERLLLGSSFGAAAAAYAEHRPDYAQAAVSWALERAPGSRVLDLGAGTGKLTASRAGPPPRRRDSSLAAS